VFSNYLEVLTATVGNNSVIKPSHYNAERIGGALSHRILIYIYILLSGIKHRIGHNNNNNKL